MLCITFYAALFMTLNPQKLSRTLYSTNTPPLRIIVGITDRFTIIYTIYLYDFSLNEMVGVDVGW